MQVRPALPEDAAGAAELAAEQRERYETYSPVFWRRAADVTERHRPFLEWCTTSDAFCGFAAIDGERLLGLVLASRRGAMPPLDADPERTWLVDDFVVAEAARDPVGGALLEAVADAAAREEGERLVVVCACRDAPKVAFLEGAGFEPLAEWWVRALEPLAGANPGEPPVRARTGPAPPVYDPGGLTALAIEPEPSRVDAFDAWGAASGAVLGIVAVRLADEALLARLAQVGYEPASRWFARAVA